MRSASPLIRRIQPNRMGSLGRGATRIAVVLAIIYAIPHFWWAFGVDWLAPFDMNSTQGMFHRPAVRLFALYGMGLISLTSSVLTLALNEPWGTRLPWRLLGAHGILGFLFLIFRGGIGLLETTLLASGMRDCPLVGCKDWYVPGEVSFTTAFWEPLFTIWGISLLIATWCWWREGARHGVDSDDHGVDEHPPHDHLHPI